MKTGVCELCRRKEVEVSAYGLCAGKDLSGCRHALRWSVNEVNRLLERHRKYLEDLPSRIAFLEEDIKELKNQLKKEG